MLDGKYESKVLIPTEGWTDEWTPGLSITDLVENHARRFMDVIINSVEEDNWYFIKRSHKQKIVNPNEYVYTVEADIRRADLDKIAQIIYDFAQQNGRPVDVSTACRLGEAILDGLKGIRWSERSQNAE